MPLLQPMAKSDAQQTGKSSNSWSDIFAKLVGWSLGPNVQTSVQKAEPSQMREIAGHDQQARGQITTLANNETFEAQNLHQRFFEVTAELCRTRVELSKVKDENYNLQMEKAELKRENNMLRSSTKNQRENRIIRPSAFYPLSNIARVKLLDDRNYDLRQKNIELESRIASILKELQKVHEENDALHNYQWHSHYTAEMTEIYQRNLYQIRRRIIVEKMTKVLGNTYGQKRKRESFDNWSRRVRYPGWENMTEVATRVIRQGNKVAHQATRTELQAAINFGPVYVDEEDHPEEAEVLQKMLDIIYNEGGIGEDDEIYDYDNYDPQDAWWSCAG